MKTYYNIHTIWIAMMVLTLSTYAIGKSGSSGVIAALFLILTVVIKGTLIIREFMELKGVSFIWRAIMFGWLWTVCFAIAVIYFFSI